MEQSHELGKNKERDFKGVHKLFDSLLFVRQSVYDEEDFDRHFRTTRHIFGRIEEEIKGSEMFSKEKMQQASQESLQESE